MPSVVRITDRPESSVVRTRGLLPLPPVRPCARAQASTVAVGAEIARWNGDSRHTERLSPQHPLARGRAAHWGGDPSRVVRYSAEQHAQAAAVVRFLLAEPPAAIKGD